MHKKGFAPIIILIFLALLITGAAFYYRTQKPLFSTVKTESVKTTDKSNLISIEIPMGWKVTSDDGARGVSLSSFAVESSDFKTHTGNDQGPFTQVYYDSGAAISFGATKEYATPTHFEEGVLPSGGIISQDSITIDGISGAYYVFKEPSTAQGQLLEATVNHNGNDYFFRFGYNPTTYPQGEDVFKSILQSVKFL